MIDIAKVFSHIFARNIVHVTFGEDLCDEEFTLKLPKDGIYVDEKVALKDIIIKVGPLFFTSFYKNALIPINWLF